MVGTPKIRHRVLSVVSWKYMKGYPLLTPEQKREIIGRVKEKGERVVDLAKEYGVKPGTIYGYLSRSGQNSGALLELAKLKREKDALLKIVGQLVVDQRLGKKIQRRYGH